MKLIVVAFAALLLSSTACSKKPAAPATPEPQDTIAFALPADAGLPDEPPAPAATDTAPSAEEVAAFETPVPK